MLAKFSRVEYEKTVSKFRKRKKKQIFCCVHVLFRFGENSIHTAENLAAKDSYLSQAVWGNQSCDKRKGHTETV